MGGEGVSSADVQTDSTDCLLSLEPHLDIPGSPTVQHTGKRCYSFRKLNMQSSLHQPAKCEFIGAGVSSLKAGDLGKQMAVAEVSDKISSRALLTVNGSRFMRNLLQLELTNSDCFSDTSTKESRDVDPFLQHDALLKGRKSFGAANDTVCDGVKGTVPVVDNEVPAISPNTPATHGSLNFEETGDPASVTLEEMLREASTVHGIQLKWLLYGMSIIVTLVLAIVVGEVQIAMGDKTVILERESVGISAAMTVNQVRWLHYSIRNVIQLFGSTRTISSEFSIEKTRSHLCRSIGGAPLVFAVYKNKGSTLVEFYTCPLGVDRAIEPPLSLNNTNELLSGALHISVYTSDSFIAMIPSTENLELLAVFLHKEPVGHFLLARSNIVYSASALKHSVTAILLPELSTSNPVVAVHSLNHEYTNYGITQSTPLGGYLQKRFNSICAAGKAYTWHTVMRPVFNRSHIWEYDAKSPNNMNVFYIEKKKVWGGVLGMIICGVVCIEAVGEYCTYDNPTNTWFIVVGEPLMQENEVALAAIAVVILIAIILFLIMVTIVYVSVSVPVQHLKLLIFNTIGDKRTKTPRERLFFQYTRRCWLGDLQALVKTFQLLSFCFRLNKKYVPQHVLEQQVIALRGRKDYVWRTIVEKMDTDDGERGEGDDDIVGNDQEVMKAFVNTVSAIDKMPGVNMLNMQNPLFRRESGVHNLTSPEGYLCEGNLTLGTRHNNNIDLGRHGMMLVEGSTILAVHLCAVEMAYFTNYRVALKQHRRIMNLLLERIRHYRGELFERSGDCIAAAWNAFESRVDHAPRAASCALSIARLLAHYRKAGFRVGIVLHQGPFVSGVVEDNKEAFTTVFGTVPRQAIALAELAASLPFFHVLVSEPVKQSLASLYECIIVDVIKYHENDNPIVMFELNEERRLPLVKGTPLAPSTFAEEHARVFFDFRNHDFERALTGIEQLRCRFPENGPQLLRRIELLCKFYMHRGQELPMPYFRPYPTWQNYEAIANVDYMPEMCVDNCKDVSLSDTLRFGRTSKSIYEDDTAKFRQELHDNVLASKRTQCTNHFSPTRDVDSQRLERTNVTPLSDSASVASTTQLVQFLPPPIDVQENMEDGELMKEKEAETFMMRVMTSSSRRVPSKEWMKTVNNKEDGTAIEGQEGYERDSVLSIRTPTNMFPTSVTATTQTNIDDNDGNAAVVEGGSRRERSLLVHSLRSAAVDSRACNFLYGTDSLISFNSETMHNAAFTSFGDLDKSLEKVANELPQTIVAKNGIEYIRSSRILGKGSFGCVYLGMETLSGRLVAIKFLPLPSDEEEIAKVESEVVTMQKVKSNHVVEFISYGFKNNLIIIVMECMMAGSLQGLISGFTKFHSATARLFIRDVLRGLHKLHSMGIIHRDVKPQNVLHALAGNCKISDFGASAFLQELVRKQMEGKGLQVQGTPVYLAPEAARGKPEEKSDIWSCGIMFIQLVTGKLPYIDQFLQMPPQILVYQIGSGAAKPIIPESLDEFDADFVYHCLRNEPTQRFSAQRLLELPLFEL